MDEFVYINARFLTQKIAGVQRFAIELSKRLKKLDTNFKFISPPGIYHKDLAKELEVETFGKLKSHLWEQIELPVFLKTKGNPLLINLCSSAPLFYKNQIVTIHDAIFFHHPEWFSKPFSLWYNFLVPKIAKNSKQIITVSEHAKSDLSSYLRIPLEKFVVIYNSVDDIFFEDKLVPKAKIILSVSSLDPRKNFENLIKGYLSVKDCEYDLVIVGAESKSFPNHDLFNIVKNNPKIKFTGYISDIDLVKYYQEATVFVYPSLYEGFGIPPLEAMKCGTPVIVANNSSIPEVCNDAALYVDALDFIQIGDMIKELLRDRDLQQKLVENGRINLKRFSWETSTLLIYNLIKSLK